MKIDAMNTKDILGAIDTYGYGTDELTDDDVTQLIVELYRRSGCSDDDCSDVEVNAKNGVGYEALINGALKHIPKHSVVLYQAEDTVDGDSFIKLLTYSREEAIRTARSDWDHLTPREQKTHSVSVNAYTLELPTDSEFGPKEAWEYAHDYDYSRLGSYDTIEWREEE